MNSSATIRAERVSMRRWIAIVVLATQMLAGVCVADASVNPANPCCHDCGIEISAKSCSCCQLDSPSMPSHEAIAPLTVAPPMLLAASAIDIETPGLQTLEIRSFRSGLPAAALSPPRLYLRNTTFLI